MSCQSMLRASQSFGNRNRVRPEAMSRKVQIRLEHLQGAPGSERSGRKCWVGKDPNECGLSEGTSGPTGMAFAEEPAARPFMELMFRPSQRNQDIHVQQKYTHLDFILK